MDGDCCTIMSCLSFFIFNSFSFCNSRGSSFSTLTDLTFFSLFKVEAEAFMCSNFEKGQKHDMIEALKSFQPHDTIWQAKLSKPKRSCIGALLGFRPSSRFRCSSPFHGPRSPGFSSPVSRLRSALCRAFARMALVRLSDQGFLNGKNNPRYFLDALSEAFLSNDFPDLKSTTHRGLPSLAHLFYPRILHGLGSLFGRPLKIDNATAVGSRPSVARVLVELDISKSYSEVVWIGPDNLGYVQKVVMEEFPPYCDHSKSLGHKKTDCCTLHPHLGRAPPRPLGNDFENLRDIPNDSIVGDELPLAYLVGNGNLSLEVVEPSITPVALPFGCAAPLGDDVQLDSVLPLAAPVAMFDPPKQVFNRIDMQLSVDLPAAPSCGNYVDYVDACEAPSCGIIKDVVEACEPNHCLINLVASPIVSPYSNVDVGEDEAIFAEASVPLEPGDHDSDSSAGGISVSLPKGDDTMADILGLTLVDVPISVLSNDAMLAQLTCNARDYEPGRSPESISSRAKSGINRRSGRSTTSIGSRAELRRLVVAMWLSSVVVEEESGGKRTQVSLLPCFLASMLGGPPDEK
ncbi:hypothetical protein M5K25_022720 [Dendrobium thyrsiflorum]|uniref:Uncharacterized protein n=1 Tax=Dendrobium thyrsiflorum TaxID=117978 RepID=A0ABD0U6T0_DENTH